MSIEAKIAEAKGRVRKHIVPAAVEKVATAKNNNGIVTLSMGQVVPMSIDIDKLSKLKDYESAKIIAIGENTQESYTGAMYKTRHMTKEGREELLDYCEGQLAVSRAVRKELAEARTN